MISSGKYEGHYEDPAFFSYRKQVVEGSHLIASKFCHVHVSFMEKIIDEAVRLARLGGRPSTEELNLLVNEAPVPGGKSVQSHSEGESLAKLMDIYGKRHIPVEDRKVALSILNDLGVCVGFMYLYQIHWINRTSTAIMAFSPHLSRELISDAIELLKLYAFGVLNLRKLSVLAATADKDLYLSEGFAVDCHYKKHWLNEETGEYTDTYEMSVLNLRVEK